METDISNKLNALLADPEMLKTVMSAVSGLAGQSEATSQKTQAAPPVIHSGKSDERSELLRALKPFLSKEKCSRIDKMLRVMTFAELAGLLSGSDGK